MESLYSLAITDKPPLPLNAVAPTSHDVKVRNEAPVRHVDQLQKWRLGLLSLFVS